MKGAGLFLQSALALLASDHCRWSELVSSLVYLRLSRDRLHVESFTILGAVITIMEVSGGCTMETVPPTDVGRHPVGFCGGLRIVGFIHRVSAHPMHRDVFALPWSSKISTAWYCRGSKPCLPAAFGKPWSSQSPTKRRIHSFLCISDPFDGSCCNL